MKRINKLYVIFGILLISIVAFAANRVSKFDEFKGGTFTGTTFTGTTATMTTVTGTTVNGGNLRTSGNSLISTDTNGNITLNPDGTGETIIDGTALIGDSDGDSAHTIGGVAIQSAAEIHTSGGSSLGGLSVHRLVDSATLGAHFLSYKARGTSATPAVVQSGDVISRFAAAGHDGTDYELGAEIKMSVDATPGAGDMPGRIGFFTSLDGAASPTEAVRIDSGQDLNIMSQNELRFQDSSGGEYMSFKAPSTVTASTTFTWPDGDGSNGQSLSTNGSGTLEWATSAGGAGVNYFSGDDYDFENGVGTFATYDDAASTPVDGTGGSPSRVTISQETTDPMAGTGSLKISKGVPSGGDDVGEGASVDFTVDKASLGNVVSITFDYETDSDYADDEVEIWIYDVDNSQLIQPVPSKLKASTIPGKFSAQFQATYDATKANADSYRLIFHQAVTNAAATHYFVDNLSTGPPKYSFGVPSSDWTDFTPTGSWSTNTTYSGRWQRVADSMEVRMVIDLTGAPTATTLEVNLPSGYSIDTSKVETTTAADGWFGSGQLGYNAFGRLGAIIAYKSTTQVAVLAQNDASGDSNSYGNLSNSSPRTAASGDQHFISFKVPILGWSSNVQMSEDADTRVSAILYTGQPTGTLTGSYNKATIPTKLSDTHGAYSSGVFTAKSHGFYDISAQLAQDATYALNQVAAVRIIKNGSTAITTGALNAGGAQVRLRPSVSTKGLELSAGDTIEIHGFNNATTPTYNSGTTESWLSISRQSGPSSIAASNLISAHATNSASSSVANDTNKFMDFPTVVWDSHGILKGEGSGVVGTTKTGFYAEAPVAGKYMVSLNMAFASLSADTGRLIIGIYVGGSNKIIDEKSISSISSNESVWVSGLVDLNAGDYVEGYIRQSNGTARSLSSDASRNTFSIYRVGF